MTLIKADRTDIFFQYKQVLNPKHADRKFHKRSPYAFSLKKRIHIELCKLSAFYMNHSFDDPVVIHPDIFQSFWIAHIVQHQRVNLHLAK